MILHLFRLITYSFAAGFIVLLALYTLYRADIWHLQTIGDGFRYNYRRDIAYITGSNDRVVVSSNPQLIADYYAASGDRPLILLVHGSTSAGRHDILIRLLARHLNSEWLLLLEGVGQTA